MIQINLSEETRNKIEEYHYNAIYNGLGKKKSIIEYIKNTFGEGFSLKDFLVGDKEKTLEIIVKFESFNSSILNCTIDTFQYFINQYEQRLASTDRKDKNYYEYNGTKYNAYFLCKELKLDVCPYCNKNYMVTISDTQKEIFTRPTLDHFFCKSKYPFLALSLYNLIPSCHICNSHIKQDKEFHLNTHIHPYFEDFNKIKKFNIDRNLLTLVNKEDEFEIVFESRENISAEDEQKAEKTITDLALKELYSSHKDKVLELIDLSRAYSEASFENLVNEFASSTKIFKNPDEVKRLMLCHHIEDENIDKRPLNKLVKDISEELELI